MTTGKQENLNLIDNKLTNFSDKQVNKDYKSHFSVPRENLLYLSDYEKKQHENFLNEMKDPLWKKLIDWLFLIHFFELDWLYYQRFKTTFHSNVTDNASCEREKQVTSGYN